MRKNKLIAVNAVNIVLIIILSTVYRIFPGRYVLPDLAMLVIIFYSARRGVMEGQITGFTAGIAEDFLSLSPPGFHGLIKTVTGFLFGCFKGKIFIDPVFFPVIMALSATLVKGFLAVSIASLFLRPEVQPQVISQRFGYEILANCVAAPFVFSLMKVFRLYSSIDERSF